MSNDTSQLPPRALAELCRTSLIGAKKHGEAWRNLSKQKMIKKLYSHLRHWENGQCYDKDDGQHHLAACNWWLFCLLDKDLEDESAREFGFELDKLEANVSNEKLKEGDIYPDSECPTCGYEHCCPLCKGDLTYSVKNKQYCCSDCCSVCRKLEVKNENKS